MKFIIPKKHVFLVLITLLIANYAHSQAQKKGCLLPNNRLYSDKGDAGVYSNSPSQGLSLDYCSWTPSSGVTCEVCNGMLNVMGFCLSSTTEGIENTFTMVICPIDNSVYFLILIIGSIGGYHISRKTLI
jgi:hypothetical protein